MALVRPSWTTTYAPALIESDNIVVTDGNVVFVQPGGGVTVLDAATGAVRLRTGAPRNDRGRYQLFPTSAGVLVSGWTDFRMVDLARPSITWTLEGCDIGYEVAPQGLICLASEPSLLGATTRVTLSRLSDGKVLWTYRTSSPFAGQTAIGKGRLLLAFEDFSERETIAAGAGTLNRPVTRVIGVVILDLVSGREALPFSPQDVKLEYGPGGFPRPIEFDGQRVSYVARRAADDTCSGERRRIVTLTAAGRIQSTEDRCDAVAPKPVPDGPKPAAGEAESIDPRTVRRLPSGTLKLGWLGDAALVDVTSDKRRWLVGIPSRFSPDQVRVREDDGLIFIESLATRGVERLDALDIKTGRPLWTYVFPSFWRMASTVSFLHDPATTPGDATEWGWIQAHRPGGAFSIPLKALREKVGPGGVPGAGAPVPVILDPGPGRSR
jgi:hypothetical protein